MKVVILTASTMKKEVDGKLFSGKCVTAFDLDHNRIIRLVQNPLGAPMENPYCDFYQPLEVHDIDVLEACPLRCQTENVLTNYKGFNYLEKYNGNILDLYERFQTIDYGDSSYMLDESDRLTDISSFKHSLELIQVSELKIEGKKCSFLHKTIPFKNISITDPQYYGSIKKIGDAILAVSIPADDYKDMGYFKFVASVFPIEKPWTKEENEDLVYEYNKGWDLQLIAAVHKRKEEEIKKRLSFLLKSAYQIQE